MMGADAKGDDGIPPGGEGGGFLELHGEGGGVLDQGVGGEEDDDGIGIEPVDEGGAECAGGGGVAFGRFGDELTGGEVGEDGAAAFDLRGVGEDEDLAAWESVLDAADGLFEEGSFRKKRHEVLRRGGAAEGPEAFAAATGHDAGVGLLHGSEST